MFRNLQIVTLDFETYFSAEYSLKLKKYNTSSYIRDPQFKAQCVAIKVEDRPVVWIGPDNIAAALAAIDWSRSALLCHNTAFDGLILSHHYGVVPAFYLDTLSMARAVHDNDIGNSLDAVAHYYGVGNKLPGVLNQAKGIRDLSPEVLAELGKYCAVDTNLCREIFDKMRPKLPEAEFDQIDLTLRMFCQPVVLLDLPMVQIALDEEVAARQVKIDATGLTHKELRSDAALANAFITAGLPVEEVPRKHSVKQKKEVWAFAKGDLAFTALKEHPNKAVRALVEGRLAAKTSYGESRALRFLEAGKGGRPWPILLNYCGAHTTRWTGGDRMNPQNLKRGGVLRKAVMAPPGHVIMACDLSQIEARVEAWLADHVVMLQAFRDWDQGTGPDVYKLMASMIYAKAIEEITPDERFIGKVVVLGAGYGMGAEKYRYTLAAGTMGKPVDISEEDSEKVIKGYRRENKPFGKLWKQMDYLLYYMLEGHNETFKCLKISKEQILLPNGLVLHYPNLNADKQGGEDTYSNYTYGKHNSKIYGGLLTENVTQALARVIVADQMLAISKRYRVVTMTHDEVVCVVPEAEVEEAAKFMVSEMRKTPSWCTDLPLNAEVDYGHRYG